MHGITAAYCLHSDNASPKPG